MSLSFKGGVDSGVDFPTFMKGMLSAPWDGDKCEDCGGNGLRPVMCCGGHECGCMGMPVDFDRCECGARIPSEKEISDWADGY